MTKKEFNKREKKENFNGNEFRIIEELTLDLDVKKGSRILDLGCGKTLMSDYLAIKYDALVYIGVK